MITNKLQMKLLVSFASFVVFSFIFSRLACFHEIKLDNKIKVDWLKVCLIALIPSGIIFYLSEYYFDNYGNFFFHGVDNKKMLNESYNQNRVSTPE